MDTKTSEAILGIGLALAVFVGLPVLAWWQRRRRPKQAPPPAQIDAEWGVDYRGPGRKGEPFFSPGGVAFLMTLAAGFLFSLWFSDLIRPLVEWLVPRSPR